MTIRVKSSIVNENLDFLKRLMFIIICENFYNFASAIAWQVCILFDAPLSLFSHFILTSRFCNEKFDFNGKIAYRY